MKKNYFIPSSQLTTWRRTLTEQLTAERKNFYSLEKQVHEPISIDVPTPYELTHDKGTPVMTCKYCIRRQLGRCMRETRNIENEWRLQLANGTAFRLVFDCKNCLMKLYLQ